MNILKRLGDNFVPVARNNYTPHVLRHRSLSLYAGLMVSVKLLTLFSLDLLPQNQAFSSAVSTANVLELTNYSRKAYGLHALQSNVLLSKAAQAKAEDMLKNQYFDHNTPSGKTPWDFIKAQGYNYIIAGENLAINFYDSESLENAWMNSPGHKANILNKDFSDIGIGIAQGTFKGAKAIFVVQMFGTTADQPVKTQLAFSQPAHLSSVEAIKVPVPVSTSLAAPIIAGSDFALSNSTTYTVHGFAPEADSIYMIVNNQPQAKFDVIQGEYRGEVTLTEGPNKITAISFDSANHASSLAKSISIKVDSTAPTISASIEQVIVDGQTDYLITAQATSDVTRVVATIGGEAILLQPTGKDSTWAGTVNSSASLLQGGVAVKGYDLAGNSKVNVVADLSSGVKNTYGFLAEKDLKVSVLGQQISSKVINEIYLYFGLFLLLGLALAIGIKRNIQHLELIAHTSALVMVAFLLWIT